MVSIANVIALGSQESRGWLETVPKTIRIHELAKELGMTRAETLELAKSLGTPAKSHSSPLNEAYADMVRRRAERDGLTRDQQPSQRALARQPATKASVKKATPKVPPPGKAAATNVPAKPSHSATPRERTASDDASAEAPVASGTTAAGQPDEKQGGRQGRSRSADANRAVRPPPGLPPIKPELNYVLGGSSGPIGPVSTSAHPSHPTLSVTGRSRAARLFVHDEFFTWLDAPETDQRLVKRARFILTELLRQGFARGTKGVQGAAKGWMRAPAGGGTNGFHYYLWYVTGDSSFGREAGLGSGQLLVRAVRHHNETDEPLDPGGPDFWHEMNPNDVLVDIENHPYTDGQIKAATPAPVMVRTVSGHPGSGKTTALLLAALMAGDDRKIVYLTFNNRLVSEARSYFNTYLDDTGRVDVLSFETFLEEMADAHPGSIQIARPYQCAQALEATLTPHVARGFGAWDGLIHELYDELHAHAFGRSLPFAFRDAPASTGASIDPDEYEEIRRAEGLGEAASDAATFLRQVIAKDPERLFPGPFCARSLLDDVDAPPPPRFENVEMLLVDEVQDLTPVEVLLVLNLAARIGASSGRLPQLVLAGDESQTVRPTEFEWAWLRELIKQVLPDATFDDAPLEENLRSPQLLAEVLDATRSQYRSLAKADRPAGQRATRVDDLVPGRVIYATHPSDSYVDDLLDLAAQTPRCALVYPGAAVPDDIWIRDPDEIALSAVEAKGLDFETVVVVDAGSRQAELQRLLATVETEPQGVVRARSLADQFRVAASRSTYNLVFIDREDNVEHLESVMGRPWTLDLERVEFADLHEELAGDADDEQLLRSMVNDIDDLLLDNVHRALLRSRSATRRLDRMRRLQEVPVDLITEVHRVRGISAALTLAEPRSDLEPSERDALMGEAKIHLESAGLASPLSAYLNLVHLQHSPYAPAAWDPRTLTAFDVAVAGRSELEQNAEVLVDRLDRLVVRWVQQTCQAPPSQIEQFGNLITAMRGAVDQIAQPHHYVQNTIDDACSTWALVSNDAGRPQVGLDLIARARTINHEARARCLESLQRWAEAVDDYIAADQTAEAVRCARRGGDFERAAEIHGDHDDAVGRSIALVKALTTTIDSAGETALLPEEIARLNAAVNNRQIAD